MCLTPGHHWHQWEVTGEGQAEGVRMAQGLAVSLHCLRCGRLVGEAGGSDWGAWPPPSRAAWPFPQPQGRVEVGKAVVGGVCHALEGRPGADSESMAGPLWPLRQVISGHSSPLHSEGSVHYPAYVLCSSSFFMVSISLTVST